MLSESFLLCSFIYAAINIGIPYFLRRIAIRLSVSLALVSTDRVLAESMASAD